MLPKVSSTRHDVVLLALSCFAIAWLIARACLQSVTIDEADSYLAFATADWPAHWYPSSGNHVLNTILMRIVTSLAGLSHLTLRAPALLGAGIYVASIYALSMRIARDPWMRRPLFICLVYNPFLMDYLVAARGYSMALGFLTAGLLLMMRAVAEDKIGSNAIAASICAGLSFTANFSFGYVIAATLLMFTIWGCRRTWKAPLHVLAPACVVIHVICGSTLWTFPRSQLYYGASSLREMFHSLVSASFDELNPFVVNPLIARTLQMVAPLLPYLFVALCLLQFGTMAPGLERTIARALVAILALALMMHWLAFRIAKIPLPNGRTAIFFVPLAVLLLGTCAANRSGPAVLRVCTIALLVTASVYFTGCLRLSHFKEWEFDVDVKEAFAVLREIHRRDGISEIPADWRYSSTLNFYRRYFHEESMAPFGHETPWPADKRAYVLWYPEGQSYIASEHLRLIYRGRRSDLVIALRP